MTDYSDYSLDDLIDVITTWPVGMPVRAMERSLRWERAPFPLLSRRLSAGVRMRAATFSGSWFCWGRSGPACRGAANRSGSADYRGGAKQAAAEGLAKIGIPSLPALGQLATAPDPFVGFLFMPHLAASATTKPSQFSLTLLPRSELGDVLAQALYDQGKTEAIPFLYKAYCNCEPWQRIELEDTVCKAFTLER